ncbi:uncharacterized protein LOC142606517 [Castanea sativa]|uniref:uncharacterized protein LOC142606517 n=1 Tax=Castanea sativa TaxID=21020 RepID=UPI003F64CDC5
MPKYLNRTHIALIQKIQGLETLGNYRPISLCNTVVARLRPLLDKLISPLQAAFVLGRKGVDNVIIVQEIIHTLGKKKGKSWDKCNAKVWQPVKTSQSGLAFSHMFFANVLVLFAKANATNCSTIRDVLYEFCRLSGQTKSEAKSRVYFLPNVDRDSRESLCDILGFSSTPSLGKYLGFPIRHLGSSLQDYNFILARVKMKLAGCKENLLSLAGRTVLIQPFSAAIPSYVMQCNHLLRKILEGIDRIRYDLPLEIKSMIQATPISITSRGCDKLAWVGNPRGSFDLKSAYALTLGVDSIPSINCGWIWKFETLPRIKTFLWQCAHDSIGVKGCLMRRGMGEDDRCPICQADSKSILHALRDCSRVRAVWTQLGVEARNQDFWNTNLQDWLSTNGKATNRFIRGKPHWRILFPFAVWIIWKSRNHFVFNGKPPNPKLPAVINGQVVEFMHCVPSPSRPFAM